MNPRSSLFFINPVSCVLTGVKQKRGEKMSRSSNDQRSDALNPNNDEYQASQDNRSDQMNPNNTATDDEED